MSILSVPKSVYLDFYDQARFELTWKASLFFTLLLPILIIVFAYIEQTTVIYTAIGWVLCLFFLISLKRTGKFKLTALFFSFAGSLLCVMTLLSIPTGYHFADTLWMLIIVLFAFFTLDKVWGILIGLLNLIGVVYFIVFMSLDNIKGILEKGFEMDQRIALGANIVVACSMIGYLILQFIRTRRVAEFQLREANLSLAAQNQLITTRDEEKTVMLKEIHHRVKNNLQVVTSLLRLQASEFQNSGSETGFQDSINRVNAMALIHEKMYTKEDLAHIDVREYLEGLADGIIASYSVNIPIEIAIQSEIKFIKNKTLVPFALIINELITNSIKHVFEHMKKGKINISISEGDNDQLIMTYNDSGSWKEASNVSKSFGLELIEILTEQLEGSFARQNSEKNEWVFKLRNLY